VRQLISEDIMIFKNQKYYPYTGELDPTVECDDGFYYVDQDLEYYHINKKQLLNETTPTVDHHEYINSTDISEFEGILEEAIPERWSYYTDNGRSETEHEFNSTAVVEGVDGENVYFKVIYVEV